MQTKERIFYYDFLRAFAIIAVILCHIDIFYGSMTTPIQIITKLTINDIGRMGVPLFLMISGALLLNRDYELPSFLKKRFIRIIYPFIFWMGLTIVGLILFKYDNTYIWNVFIGNPGISWYFWTLIGIYLAIPILNAFIQSYKEEGLKYFLIIWIFVIFLKTFNSYPLFLNFKLDYFAGYIGFPVLGYYLANKEFKVSDKKVCIYSLVILIFSSIIYVYYNYNVSDFPSIYENIPMILMASSFFLLVRYFDKITSFKAVKDNIIGKIIYQISICSYGIYFSHIIVLKVLSMINPQSNLLFPVMVLVLIFLSWLMVYIVSKIPYLKIFSGV